MPDGKTQATPSGAEWAGGGVVSAIRVGKLLDSEARIAHNHGGLRGRMKISSFPVRAFLI